jgi:hypothetical protein
MARTSTKLNNPRLFEEAREAIIKLETLSRVLTPSARKEAKKLPKGGREAALETSRTLERELIAGTEHF